MAPPDGGMPSIGAPRTGQPQNVRRATPQLDATAKWLDAIGGIHTIDLGGIAELSQKKIRYGLEAHGRPVTKVTPYLVGRLVTRGQRWLATTPRPSRAAWWDTIEREALGVLIERVANAGGDLAGAWSSHPLTPAYARQKARRHPGKPMGQATGALLRDLRSAGAFAVTRGGGRR